MDVHFLWQKLRNEQQLYRNRNIFKNYDQKFIIALINSINSYSSTLLRFTNINNTSSFNLNNLAISNKEDLSELQRSLLYHVTSTLRINDIIIKLNKRANCKDQSCTIINPSTVWDNLPKSTLLKELCASRIPRYGKYIAELQLTNPSVYRAHNLIIGHAREKLALDVFYSIRQLFPNIFADKGIATKLQFALADILKRSHQETDPYAKHKSLLLYLKQSSKDSALNSILDLLDFFHLDAYIGKQLANFVFNRTDNINILPIQLDAVELADSSLTTNFNITSSHYINHINQIKMQRYVEIYDLLCKVEKIYYEAKYQAHKNNKDIRSLVDSAQIITCINKIQLLTPYMPNWRVELKDEKQPIKGMLFTQSNCSDSLNRLERFFKNQPGRKIIVEFMLADLKKKLFYNKDIIKQEIENITLALDEKIHLAKLYPTTEQVIKSINQLNELILSNTKKTFFGRISKSPVAITAESHRRKLLYLTRDRVTIAIRATPTPEIKDWDNFLANEFKAPINNETGWQNYIFAISGLGAQARFPGHLADQLKSLSEITELRKNLSKLIINNNSLLPEIDKDEVSINRIAGTSHLKALETNLVDHEKRLSCYIYYLQLTAITSLLNKQLTNKLTKKPLQNDCLNQIYKKFLLWSEKIKAQAALNDYNIQLPECSEIIQLKDNITNYAKQNRSKLTKRSQHELNHITTNLNSLLGFYYGDQEQQKSALTTENRASITVDKLGFFQKILVAIISFHEHNIQHGFGHTIKKLFSNNKNCDPTHTPRKMSDNNEPPKPLLKSTCSIITNCTERQEGSANQITDAKSPLTAGSYRDKHQASCLPTVKQVCVYQYKKDYLYCSNVKNLSQQNKTTTKP